jgi:hypothetical protein
MTTLDDQGRQKKAQIGSAIASVHLNYSAFFALDGGADAYFIMHCCMQQCTQLKVQAHAVKVKQTAQTCNSQLSSRQMHSLTAPSGRVQHKSYAIMEQGRQPGSGKHPQGTKHLPYAEVDEALEQIGHGKFQVLLLSPQGTKHLPYAEVDEALEQIGHGKFQVLLLSCISLVWAGDAAEVMVLSYLGPAVSAALGMHNTAFTSIIDKSRYFS